jgi:hypothetical protein
LYWGFFAVYGENHTEYTNTVHTSQETHYISAMEPNRLMLSGETVAVYGERERERGGRGREKRKVGGVVRDYRFGGGVIET